MTGFSISSSSLKLFRLVFPALLWVALVLPVHADILYTVEDGDSAWSIAVNFGISLEDLYEANGWASDENPVLGIGQRIAIPSDRALVEPDNDGDENSSGETTYIIQDGDTFSLIAQVYGVTTLALTEYNGLTVDDIIRPGQLLSIPPSDFEPQNIEIVTEETVEEPETPEPLHYKILAGDTLGGIARQFGITVAILLAFNDLEDDVILQIDDELLIPLEAGQLSSRSNTTRRHTVVPGDTLVGIASTYGTSAAVIAEANNISISSILRAGQELIIPIYRTPPVDVPANETNETIPEPAPVENLSDEITPLPDISDLPGNGDTGSELTGWHSEIFDFTQIEDPEPSSDDPAPVSEGGLSIDGYFEDGIPYHLYTIRRGDTLGDVAHQFGVTQSDLRDRNGLDSRSTLRIGRDLKIPLPRPVTPSVNTDSSGSVTWGAPDDPIGSYEGTATGRAVVEEASKYLGTPYVYGGNSLTGGIDCSGFTSAIYSMFGISLYRSARDQATNGYEVAYSELAPGDIVCFHTTRPGISHVGMYIGDGDFIHSSSYRNGIVISPLDEGYYNDRFVCARRVLD